jgi:hypothetical protein
MMKPAWQLELEARAVNATDWQPPPGMVKRQCDWCSYWFAAPAASHEPRCQARLMLEAGAPRAEVAEAVGLSLSRLGVLFAGQHFRRRRLAG